MKGIFYPISTVIGDSADSLLTDFYDVEYYTIEHVRYALVYRNKQAAILFNEEGTVNYDLNDFPNILDLYQIHFIIEQFAIRYKQIFNTSDHEKE